MKVRFPDASMRELTECRATYRLDRSGRRWLGQDWEAVPDTWHEGVKLRVTWPGEAPDTYRSAWLDYLGPGAGYSGGCWTGGTATGFVARQDGEAVVLELWDVAPSPPGPLHVPMVDC